MFLILYKNQFLKSSMNLILLAIVFFNLANIAYSAELSEKEIYDIKSEAFALYSTDNKKEAIKLLEQIPINQRTEDIFIILGNINDDEKKTSEAIENYNNAIKAKEDSHKAYYNIGCILLEKKSYDLAIKNFKLSIKQDKSFAYAHYNLAHCYLAQKEYKKAKKHLLKALYLKGDVRDFYISLIYCYKMLGDEKSAQKIVDSINQVES